MFCLRYIAILCSLGFATSLLCQLPVEGTVLDAENDNPVIGALVYLVSTSIYTLTDESGNFIIHLPDNNVHELGVTHLGYQSYFVATSKLPTASSLVKLQPEFHDIEVVQVKARGNKKRERYLRQFQRELFGQSDFTKNCKIENPDVLLFKSNDGNGFSVIADDLLKVTNRDLGYHIFLDIEQFEKKNITTVFGVKPFFASMEDDNSNNFKSIEKNRENAYLGSKRHFFDALVRGTAEKDGFFMNLVEITRENSIRILRTVRGKDIVRREGKKVMITLDNPVSIRYKGKKSWGPRDENEDVSYIIPNQKLIDISSPGTMGDNQFVELGFWSTQGLSTWLPADYIPDQTQSQQIVLNGFNVDNAIIPIGEIKHGGPPKDGIPAIDQPLFTKPDRITFMKDMDQILGVSYKGISRGYPIKILDRHEIVNDRFGDENLVISYCPLCNSGMVFKGEIEGRNYTFGVSGLLYNSDVLMYDRQSESLWSQIKGMAISGPAVGTALEFISVDHTTWKDWKERYPDSQILSIPDRHLPRYHLQAYADYRESDDLMFPVYEEDSSLRNKALVLGIVLNGESKAYPFTLLRKRETFSDEIGGDRITIRFDRKNNNARVFDSEGNRMVAHTMYWFAWKAFHPGGKLVKK